MSEKKNLMTCLTSAEPPAGAAAPAAGGDALGAAFEALKSHDWGKDPGALKAIDDALAASRGNAAARKGLEARLAAVLKVDVPRAAKVHVCRRLSRLGSADSVPALTALLPDEDLSHMGRYALEVLPCPEAGKALRDALPLVRIVAPGGDLRVDQNNDGYPDGITEYTLMKRLPSDRLAPPGWMGVPGDESPDGLFITEPAAAGDLKAVHEGLYWSVNEHVGAERDNPGITIRLVAKDATGQVVGGLLAWTTLRKSDSSRCRGVSTLRIPAPSASIRSRICSLKRPNCSGDICRSAETAVSRTGSRSAGDRFRTLSPTLSSCRSSMGEADSASD